jgi:hypothetical protein
MSPKQFFDWQLGGGTDDVMRMVSALEKADVKWCVIGGIAVNNWAAEPLVTQDLDFVVVPESIEIAIAALADAGFKFERFPYSVNFRGSSAVSFQLSTEAFYRDFPLRAKPGEVHSILMRIATAEDVLSGKVKAWSESSRRPRKRQKDILDIQRLVDAHPDLWKSLPEALSTHIVDPAQPDDDTDARGR